MTVFGRFLVKILKAERIVQKLFQVSVFGRFLVRIPEAERIVQKLFHISCINLVSTGNCWWIMGI